jgi:hypothetical protein
MMMIVVVKVVDAGVIPMLIRMVIMTGDPVAGRVHHGGANGFSSEGCAALQLQVRELPGGGWATPGKIALLRGLLLVLSAVMMTQMFVLLMLLLLLILVNTSPS